MEASSNPISLCHWPVEPIVFSVRASVDHREMGVAVARSGTEELPAKTMALVHYENYKCNRCGVANRSNKVYTAM